MAASPTDLAAAAPTHFGKRCLRALRGVAGRSRARAAGRDAFRSARTREDYHAIACSFIDEWVTIKGPDWSYAWVNAAFAGALGRPEQEFVGLTDREVFGYVTAQKLAQSDHAALERCAPLTVTESIHLDGRLRHFEVSKVPLEGIEGEAWGLVSVWRDRTEEIERRTRREKAMHQTVKAFAKSIQFADPYLARHSHLLARVATAVARELDLDENAVTTIELGAMLSQVGKLGIDPKILGKPGRLSDAERKEVERHVTHAVQLLRDVDFGLPVAEAVWQMYERLDGTGYPYGLRASQISPLAQILGACDVFCARIAPRAYRPKISPERALQLLEQNPNRYDASVVRALKTVVLSPEGEELIAGD